MWVEIGNDHAIEGYRDPNSDDPDLVRFRPLEGQRVTTSSIPDDMNLQQAFANVVAGMAYHLEEGAKPAWIESDNESLQMLLCEHYGITKSQNTRPKTWGKDTGLAAVPLPSGQGASEEDAPKPTPSTTTGDDEGDDA